MSVLPFILLVAMQSSPDANAGAAVASVVRDVPAPAKEPAKPAESGAPVKDQSLPKKDTAVVSAEADPEQGLEDEAQRLQQLQDEIRALLDATRRETPKQAGAVAATPAGAGPGTASQAPAPPAEQAEPIEPIAAADAFYRVGKYTDAMALYSSHSAADKEDASWVTFQKANCLRSLGRINEAIELYQKLVTEQPDSFWATEAEWWIAIVQWKATFRQN
jgi:tetratricopeptide (TPR) repeat protein